MYISDKTTQLGFQNINIYTENMETSRGSKGYKDSKNLYWRKYYELLGKNTSLDRVQCTIKPKSGNSKDYYFPAIMDNDKNQINKSELLAKSFVKVDSTDNFYDKEKRGWETTLQRNIKILHD